MTTRKFIVGNWKMNGLTAGLDEAAEVAKALASRPAHPRVAICPPATLIERLTRRVAGTAVEVGAQDCRPEAGGAFTGDVCAAMLHDAGARLVILGHSERRAGHGETDAQVAAKALAALAAGLEPIICVGESLEQRQSGLAATIVRAQVEASLPPELEGRPFAVAYEPIWAIGTGLTPSIPEIEAIHTEIRGVLSHRFAHSGASPILYGGSVKPANAREILHAAEVGGALVGGASLLAKDFLAIIEGA
ncbi:MAG TPA: triose-phosphate isomerase [Caulobacteraceae bacterium]|jgi:triosephosphate isomerase|nr:triose-phosphate isomerase [Caulobacteraceae bacterium]